jgi:hypothetical protein
MQFIQGFSDFSLENNSAAKERGLNQCNEKAVAIPSMMFRG